MHAYHLRFILTHYRLDYSWLDANRQPTRLPAPTYIEYVMTWINNRLNDETVFPTKAAPTTTASLITPSAHSANNSGTSTPVAGQPGNWIGKEGGFPQSFFQTCKAIYKQMFRVFAHIYHTHFDKIVHLSLEAHWNSFFAHFIHFARVRTHGATRSAIELTTFFRNSNFWRRGIWSH